MILNMSMEIVVVAVVVVVVVEVVYSVITHNTVCL